MKNIKNYVVVSAILERNINSELHIFIQTRWKPKTSPNYTGMIEIPAGGVEPYENIYEAISREVKEETGLIITNIVNDFRSEISENVIHDKNHIFSPFICQQSLETNGGLPWVGFVFRCGVTGKIKMQKNEAKDPRWISINELKHLIQKKPETIFPLQFPVLKQYLSFIEKNK
ncbi:MAG: NUDIX hydrolase [Candidatus Shapirobacteria bacterium]